MKIKIFPLIIFAVVIQEFFLTHDIFGCSELKVTMHNKTIVGNNEDYWDPDTRIWFEAGYNGDYGAVYVGYSALFPEGGMNEKGLMFDGLAVSGKTIKHSFGKKQISETELKKKIMKECATVQEVKNLIDQYNISFWFRAVWMFVDKTGNYLIVDGDSLISGNNKYFIQTNFHPSDIKDEKDIDCWRYKKASYLLEKHCDSSIEYCTSLMDSIHTNGTQYTTVYDLNNDVVYLYCFHDYKKFIRFNLSEELKTGDKILIIPELFPENKGAFNNYSINKKIKDSLGMLRDIEIVRDSLKVLNIKNSAKNMGNAFLVERYLNNFGYEWLNKQNNLNAIIVFKLNVELFPQSSNVYDSLGEAYMTDKQYKAALENYTRSVELDERNIEGKLRIKLLKDLLMSEL
jgi:tetratricopeptide (TPR) repeat protein